MPEEPQEILNPDLVVFRRMVAYELERQANLLQNRSRSHAFPVWVPIVLSGLLAIGAGWIGMVQHDVELNRQEILRIAYVQYQRTSLVTDIADLKARVLANENIAQQIPGIRDQLINLSAKMDRLIERQSQGNRGFP